MNDDAIPQSVESENDHPQRQDRPPHRILVVDDEALVRNLIAEALVDYGYRVDVAADGLEAWNTLQDKYYDLLITDNNMPSMSGLELLDGLRAASRSLPVILVTGTAPEREFARMPHPQAVVLLLKPFTIIDLLVAVKKSLSDEMALIAPTQSVAPYTANTP